MEFIIFTEAGSDIGLGHLTRCIALYDEIKSRNLNVKLFIFGDLNTHSLLLNKNYKIINWMSPIFLENSISHFDYIIIDSYIANEEIYRIIHKLSNKFLIVDDFERLNYPGTLVLNPAIKNDYKDEFLNNHFVLKGLDYIILRKEFLIRKFNKTKLHVEDVLVMIGGTDNLNLIPIIINEICIFYKDIKFHIVFNKDVKSLENLNEEKNIIYYKDLSSEEISNLMSKIDFAISSAGQSIYELIYLNKPFISIQVAENQKNNINFLKEKVSDELILSHKDLSLIEKLRLSFDKLCAIEFREEIKLKMNDIIDGFGSKRIIDFMILSNSLIFEIEIRKACFEDLLEVYKLSNSEYVRKFSINSSEISWESHINWFNTILESSSNEFYIITNKEKEFLGQVRFSIENNYATISISFKENILGKGLSKFILTRSIYKLFNERKEVDVIIAYISKENVPSQKLFSRSNFQITDNIDRFDKFILERRKFYEN